MEQRIKHKTAPKPHCKKDKTTLQTQPTREARVDLVGAQHLVLQAVLARRLEALLDDGAADVEDARLRVELLGFLLLFVVCLLCVCLLCVSCV